MYCPRWWRWEPGGQDYPRSCVRCEFGEDGLLSIYMLLLLLRKPKLSLLYIFFIPLEVGQLKLHTNGDVNLSHSLGIVGECAGS
jgi:hypothetical protein